MNYLLMIAWLLVLLMQTAAANTYLSCGAGLRHQSWPDNGWLQNDGDDYSFIRCRLQADPPMQQQGWLKTIPELTLQQGLPTGVSRSRGLLQAQQADLYWPLWRYDDLLIGILAGYGQDRQQHRTGQTVRLSGYNSNTSAGSLVLLHQQESYTGISLDSRLSETPITRTNLLYRYRQQPLLIRIPGNTNRLTTADMVIREVNTEREALGLGIQWHWSLGLFHSAIHSLHSLPADSLDNHEYIGARAHLGLLWRYRIGRHLYPYIDLKGEGEYWYAGNAPAGTPAITSFSLLNYEFSSGITWRF